MKYVLLALALVSSAAFASEEQTVCNQRHLQILDRAEGPKKKQVQELLMLETPNFSCEVTTKRFMFPMDCGRFTFTEYHYDITVADKILKAVVRDGRISCTGMTKTELSKVSIKKFVY